MNKGNEQKSTDAEPIGPRDAIGEILALSAQQWILEVEKKRCICCGGPHHVAQQH